MKIMRAFKVLCLQTWCQSVTLLRSLTSKKIAKQTLPFDLVIFLLGGCCG